MVIALDKHKRPLGFLTERRARILMEKRRACIYRVFPAVVIIKDVDSRAVEGLPSYRIKIDPGSKHTGIAIVRNDTDEALFFLQVEHRGDQVHRNKQAQKNARRNRRSRGTGYRRCKYGKGEHDSPREEGWLPPSVKSTADNVVHWVRKLSRWVNITECSFEAVRFDTQLMDNPDIEGAQYQQGELFGYELREYLLDKYGHTCQYCQGASGDPVLEWEHIRPRSRGGSDSVKNATLSCACCNRAKGSMTAEEWNKKLRDDPALPQLQDKQEKKAHLSKEEALLAARIKGTEAVMEGKCKAPDRYCAWVNATRRMIESFLFDRFGDVECASGGRTKYNRTKVLGLPKDHHYDALSVGTVPAGGYRDRTGGYVLYARAMGRGSRLRGLINECGVIVTKFRDRSKTYEGFMTGDIVTADVPEKYKARGRHTGRITIRKSGYFLLLTTQGEKKTVRSCFCRVLQKQNGYAYHYGAA